MKKIFNFLTITFFLSNNIHAQTWTSNNAGIINVINYISFPTVDTGYVVSDLGEIRRTFTGATSWSTVTPPALVGPVFFTSGLKGCVCGDSSIYRTTNGGGIWTEALHDNRVTFSSIYFVNTTNGFAGGFDFAFDSVRLYKTVNGGITWSPVCAKEAFFPDQAFCFFNSASGFWANNFNIFSTTNAGISFNSVYNDISMSDYVVNMSFPNIDTGFAVGSQSTFLKSINGGATWSLATYPGGATYDIHFFDGKKGFACGGNGAGVGWVQQTSNSGTSWSPSYSSANTFNCMAFPTNSVGYVGGQNGTVLKFTGIPTGIVENKNQQVINIFPNPTTESVNITNIIPGAKVSLLNLTGQILKEQTAETSSLKINLENIAPGIYFIEMENAGEKSVQKVVVL